MTRAISSLDNQEDRERLSEELRKAALESDRMLRDHWSTIMEGRLFKRIQQVCEERGISYGELTPEEWRELALEVVLDKDQGICYNG